MNGNLQILLRSVLILILAVGPLQAQTVFACPMMDRVMEECCCDDHQPGQECVSSNCESAVGISDGPCCDRSVEINVDEDARQDTRIAKSLEMRSPADPPPAITTSFDLIAAPRERVANDYFRPQPIVRHSGSYTYLFTRRLRI